ncbi:hypothetical protein BBJ28_00022254 [Nothophytophthora sp. Chile5]|nr:hypothetical protein BBJ28_00022254 [Nothophytophthora sp. Chile5]
MPAALLALLLGVCLLHAATPVRTRARFSLVDEPRKQHELVQRQLEAMGVERFEGDENDATSTWALLATQSAEIDLVWSAVATPPFDRLVLPHVFTTKVNHLPGAELLTSADALSQHMLAQRKNHGKFFLDFVPMHFDLPRDRDQLTSAFTEVRKKAEFEAKRLRDPHAYQRFLVHERALNGDEDQAKRSAIFITEEDLQFKLQSSAFKDKAVAVEQYIEPFLLDNHKFRVGFYVAVTSVDPLRIYVHDHPLIKIATAEYPSQLQVESDAAAYTFDDYIAPWDFPDLQTDFFEIPSDAREGTNAWHVVKKYMRKKGVDTKRLQDEVDAAIAKTVLSSRGKFQSELAKLKRAAPRDGEDATPSELSDSFFDLWKFDIEIDDKAKPWLVDVQSNPSLAGKQTVLGTDEAIKKRMLRDLLNLVGVHPQARLPFEQFFRPADTKFCADKCRDKNRAWDSSCWSCPGWFSPDVARKLFAATTEYARRGRFNLVFPSLELELAQFLDTPLSEYDLAFERYVTSLASGYADLEDFPASDRTVVCVYREHCSNHGDCVNGVCSCDGNYEGRTCYIPKDPEMEDLVQQEQVAAENAAAGAQDAETWKERVEHLVWNRGDVAGGNTDLKKGGPNAESFPASKLFFGLLVLAGFLFGAHRVFLAVVPSTDVDLEHDGKAM